MNLKTAFLCLFAVSAASSVVAFSVPSGSNTNSNNNQVHTSRRDVLQKSVATAASLAFFGNASPAKAAADVKVGGKIQYGDESIMKQKAHGTSEQPVQDNLLYGVSTKLADKICNFNR